MDQKYIEEILENTKEASKQWNEFAKECKDIKTFQRTFHLRPTKDKVTIVSTLEAKPMRGKKVGKTTVKRWLSELYNISYSKLSDEEKSLRLTELDFEDRKESSKDAEEVFQAKMISDMSKNQSLKNFLKVDQLIFIASEFILHDREDQSKRERIDIIGYDGRDRLFFFELKKPSNKKDNPVTQVKRYVEVYTKEKGEEMKRVLREYPIHSVNSDHLRVEGYAVYGYGETVDLEKSIEFHKNGEAGVIRFQD